MQNQNNTEPRTKLKKIEKRASGPPAERDKTQQTYHGVLLDAAKRTINRETLAVGRAVKKYVGQRSEQDFLDWLDDFYRGMDGYLKETFGPVFRSFLEQISFHASAEINIDFELDDDLKQFVEDYIDGFTKRHIDSSLGQIRSIAVDGEIEDLQSELNGRLEEWTGKRAEKIALRESVTAGSAVAAFVFFQAGRKIVWRTRGKSCPYCKALDGTVVGRDQPFVKEGKFEPEGANNGPMAIKTARKHPQLHQGCDCFIVAK